MAEATGTRIENGVEFYSFINADGERDEGVQCAKCGSSVEWVDCGQCGGDDEALGSDCIDDLCHGGECIHGDSGFIRCDFCRGAGGWYRCLSTREWCDSHPMAVQRGTPEGPHTGDVTP